MRTVLLGPRSWKLPDIAADARGWVVTCQDEADGAVVLLQLHPNGERRVDDVRIPAGGGNAYPVLRVDAAGHTWWAWRDERIGGCLLDVTASAFYTIGYVYGNAPIALGPDHLVAQADPQYRLVLRTFADPATAVSLSRVGKPDGLATVSTLVADVRDTVPGMVNPQRAGSVVIGEADDRDGQPCNLARWDDGAECVLWRGALSFTPRLATDGVTYATVTYGPAGLRLALLTREDFQVPVPVPVPLPDIPFTPDPNGRMTADEVLAAVLGRTPILEPRSDRQGRGEIYRPKNNPPEFETWAWARDLGWFVHVWDQSRRPGDPGWFWQDSRWIPLRDIRTGDEWAFTTTLFDRTAGADPRFHDSYARHPVRRRIVVEVGYGRYGGYDCRLRVRIDNRQGPRPAPAKGQLGRQEHYVFSPDAPQGWIYWESLKDSDLTGETFVEPKTPVVTHGRVEPYAPSPRPAWAPVFQFPADGPTRPQEPPPEPPRPPQEPPMPIPTREAFARDFAALNDFYAADEGLQRPGGLVIDSAVPVRADVEAMARWGYDLLTGTPLEAIRQEIRRSDEWRIKHPNAEPGPGTGGGTGGGGGGGGDVGPLPPIRGRLRVVDGVLHDGTAPFAWHGLTEFDLLHRLREGDERYVVAHLDRAARYGRNVVRVLGMARILFDLAPSQAHWRAALDRLLALAALRGQRVALDIFADAQLVMPDHGQRETWARALCRDLRDDPRVVIRAGNEVRKNGWSETDDPRFEALLDVIADALGHRDFVGSDCLDDDGNLAQVRERYRKLAARTRILAAHPSRAEQPGRVRWVEHLKLFRDIADSVGRSCVMVIYEPMGVASRRDPGRRDPRPAVHGAAAAHAACMGLGYVLHYIAQQDDAIEPALAACAAATTVEQAPGFRYVNANLDGSWIGTFEGWEKIRPCHNGERAYAAGVGLETGPVEVRAGWQAEQVWQLTSPGADGLETAHGALWRAVRR